MSSAYDASHRHAPQLNLDFQILTLSLLRFKLHEGLIFEQEIKSLQSLHRPLKPPFEIFVPNEEVIKAA